MKKTPGFNSAPPTHTGREKERDTHRERQRERQTETERMESEVHQLSVNHKLKIQNPGMRKSLSAVS